MSCMQILQILLICSISYKVRHKLAQANFDVSLTKFANKIV